MFSSMVSRGWRSGNNDAFATRLSGIPAADEHGFAGIAYVDEAPGNAIAEHR